MTILEQMLEDTKSVAILGHIRPDGDCLGSQLGLAAALKGLGKRVTCLLAKDEPSRVSGGVIP